MAEIFRGMEEIETREVVHVMKTLMKKLYAKAVELSGSLLTRRGIA